MADSVSMAHRTIRGSVTLITWMLLALILDGWVACVLHPFAYTRAWGERSTAWLLELSGQFGAAIAAAVPGVLTVMLIFVIARLASRVIQRLLERVEQGEIQLAWLDVDIAAPTRRLSAVVI